jgi:nitroimidazol reductase NimA-like FMN-containing flavoprotein (pyridoxamine 5'-phosphate oxidase superfamily)
MTEMSKAEISRFLMQGTFTGKLATVKEDGSSHAVPIWFVLDKRNSREIE